MGIRRHVLAISVAFGAVVGAVIAVPSTVSADEIVNGDFGTGDTAGWNAYPNPSVIDGFGCIDVPAGTGAYGAGFAQNVTLLPDTDYTLTFDAKLLTGSGTPGPIRAVVQLPRPPWTQYLPEQAIAADLTTDVTSFEYAFTTPGDLPPLADGGDPDGPNAEVGIQQNGATGEAYVLCVDDVVLHSAGVEQVVNGGFDDGLAGWNAYPNASVTDGAGCIAVPAGTGAYGAGFAQMVTLEPDTDYTLTFVAHLRAGSGVPGPIRAVVQLPRPPWSQYLPEQAISGQLGTAPTDFSFTFTTPSDLPPATDGGDPAGPHAELAVQQNGATGEAYQLCVDDVSLVGGGEVPPYEPDTASSVRVNQVGYLQHGPKRATLVSDSVDPIAWELHDAGGVIVAAGETVPFGWDASAGLDVHEIEFSTFTGDGSGYTLVADGETSFPFDIGVADEYDRMRYDALNYYYPARSGIEIDGSIAGPSYARPAGHVAAPADGVANQGDLDVPCQSIANQTNDNGDFHYGSEWSCPDGYSLDVVGGWYDAGDHGKYVVNGGISVAQLMNIYERTLSAPTANSQALADGTLRIPETGNGVPDVLDEARWELEWMLDMQVPAGSSPQLIDGTWTDVSGMAHHKIHDEGWTGLPLMPHDDAQVRSLHRPSTAATLNLAAVAAQGARLFAPYDADFAKALLSAAREAYRAALANPSVYATAADGGEGGGPYDDADVDDEFYWAAAELYLTTGQPNFAGDLHGSPLHTADVFDPGGFSWDDMAPIARIDLATVPNDLPDRAAIRQSVVDAGTRYLSIQSDQPFGHPYAGDEDGQYVWGSNSQILNNLVVMGVAFDLTGDDDFRDGVAEGIDYLLGRNSLNWSYVTGYGEAGYNSVNQHSRWWSAQLDPSLPHPPPGSVSGGPNSLQGTWDPVAQSLFLGDGCAPQRCYIDDIQSWSTNELTVNWNAPMAWVASFLADQDDGDAAGAGACSVRLWLSDVDWRESYSAKLEITNSGLTDLDGWVVQFALPGGQQLITGRGGSFSSDGATVTVRNRGRNSGIDSGMSRTITFDVRSRLLTLALPEVFRLDGRTCELVGAP